MISKAVFLMTSFARSLIALFGLALVLTALPATAAEKLSVTNYGVNVATLPWAIALEKGMFQKQGLDIDGILGSNGGGTAIRNTMANTNLPFGEVSFPSAVAAIQSGLNLKIVYGGVNNFGDLAWVTRRDAPFKTIADLKGHKVAFTEPRSATEMVLRTILRKAKVDVDTMPSGGIGAGIIALDQSAVDAAPFEEPLLLPDLNKYRVIFRVVDYAPEDIWQVGVVDADFGKSHPDVVRKLIAVRRDAIAYMKSHPADAAAVYHKVWNNDDPRIAQILPSLIKSNYWSTGALDPAGFQAMLNGMQLVGALDKPFDLKAALDGSYLR
jgi:NitT/TauT family transport system substrate-binding protein